MVTQVSSGGLTSVELSLVEHVGSGEWLDLCAKGEAVDEAAMRSWGESRTCRASVIRDILRGRLAADPDPHGLQLRGARISGRLDLESLTTDVNLQLHDCLLGEGINALNAHLASVVLIGCLIEHPTEPALDATQLACGVLGLSGARVTGHVRAGAVVLPGAHIGGVFDCTGASLRNDSGPALSADGLQVGLGLFLRSVTATGGGEAGAVRLTGAHVGGNLECDGASLCNDSGPALSADSLQVDLNLFLRGGFTATGAGLGAVRLLGARIGGQVNCNGASLRNDSGPALTAESLQVGLAMFLSGGFTATGAGSLGAVRLADARIGGQLACSAASLRNDSGPALVADNLQVGEGLYLSDGFTATGSGAAGAVRLVGAHIGGRLGCDGAHLRNDSGPALGADGLEVGQDMYLSDGFTATGSDADGAVRLVAGHIASSLACTGADLRNDSGPALNAGSLQVGQGLYLDDGFTATGSGADGAVRLVGAHIGVQFGCDGVYLTNDSGPALSADGLQVGQAVFLRKLAATGSGADGAVRLVGAHVGGILVCDGGSLRNDSGPALVAEVVQVGNMSLYRFTAIGGGDGVVVDVMGARVNGTLGFDPERLEHVANPQRRLAVDGLTYSGVPWLIPARDWLDLLRHGTPRYAAQPYQQLAAGYRALGNERQARQILMAQRDDELTRADTGGPERLWGKITKITLGYGYQPWKALLFLAGVLVLSCLLAVTLGSHGALAQTNKTSTPGRPCTVIQQLSVGLDLNLPVGTSVARASCDLSKHAASATATWLTAVGWLLRLLAWVFAALFIAGFTSAVRKT